MGLLYVKKERIPEIWPNIVAPGWGRDVEPDVSGARRFESMGQRDDAALAAVGTAVDFHRVIGAKRIESRVYELASRLKAGLKEAGFKFVTPLDAKLSAGVCIVDVQQEKRREVFNQLYHRYGIAGAAVRGLRLCPHIYNTREHIERAVSGIKEMRDLIVSG